MKEDQIDNLFKQKVKELDAIYPVDFPNTDSLWESLQVKRNHSRIKRQRLLWNVAASLLALCIVGSVWMVLFHRTDKISTAHLDNSTLLKPQEEALEYISKLCGTHNIACTSQVIQELQQDLQESSVKLTEINQQIQVYGSNDKLMRAKVRIENHQARVIKAIVQTL